jgi:hypothetical protein
VRTVGITVPTPAVRGREFPVRGCTAPGNRCSRTHSGRRRPGPSPRTANALVTGVRLGEERRAVKPSAQPTLVRTKHLPPPAKTAPWLRKRGPAGRFLLITLCISLRHYGSMHGSVRVHMVYSVRAELAVRITAPSAHLAVVRGGADSGQHAEAGRTSDRRFTDRTKNEQRLAGSAQGGLGKDCFGGHA